MAIPPKYHMIVPDRSLRESTLQSATSQGGMKGNVGFSATSNNGNMKLFLNGSPTTETTYNFLINSGGKVEQSTFLWKKSSEADTEYRGENDLRFFHDVHSPFPNLGTEHCSAAYIKSLDRELLYHKYDEDTIKVYYRTASDTYGNYTWANQSINITAIAGYGIDGSFDVCVLNDAIILCAVHDNDIFIYKSTDGLTFTLLSPNVFSRSTETKCYPLNIKIASSGNFLRIIFSTFPFNISFAETLFSMASFDGGSSWKLTNSTDVPNYPDNAVLTGKYFVADRYVYDICSYDDSGTFIICMMESSAQQGYASLFTKTYLAYSNQPYSEYSELQLPTHTPQNIFIQNASDYIIAFIEDITSDFDTLNENATTTRYNREYKVFYKLKSSDLSSGWIDLNSKDDVTPLNLAFLNNLDVFCISGFLGQGDRSLKIGKLVSTGSALFLFSSMYDRSTMAMERTTAYIRFSDWSNRPAYDMNYENYLLNVDVIPNFDQLQLIDEMISTHQPKGRFMVAQWNYINGIPAGGWDSGTNTPWQVFRQNTIAFSNTNQSGMIVRDLSSTGQCIFRYIDPHILDNSYSNPNYKLNHNSDSPPVNWFFIPRNDNSVYPDPKLYHGSCIRWVMKVTGGTLASTSCFVRINGYVSRDASTAGVNYTRIQVAVRLAETGLVIRDEIASTTLATLTPPSGTYGSTPFADEYWEFRWAWFPEKGTVFSGDIANCILVCRKMGTNAWLATTIVQPSKSTSVSYPSSNVDLFRQAVQFGHLTATSSQVSYWKEFGVHAGNDMATFRLSDATFTDVPVFDNLSRAQAYRGRLTSREPILIGDKLDAIWGGGSAFDGDSFTADIAYSYSALNPVKYDSGRISYRSATNLGAGNVDLVFKAPDNEIFYHSAISLFKTNATTATIQYSDDNVSYSTSKILSFVQAEGVVSSASGNQMAISFDSSYSITGSKFSSDDKKSFYLKVHQAAAGAIWSDDDQYLVDRMYGEDTLLLTTGVTQMFDSSVVGSTIYIYCDRASGVYSAPVAKKYMKIRLTSSSNFMPETYAQLGSAIAGTTYTFTVPLNWEYVDNEQPNIESMRSRGNVTWGYKLGPASRTLDLRMEGDVSQQKRREFRDLTRTTMNYAQYGAVLVNNANDDDPDNIFFGRLISGSNDQNEGWYYDEVNQRWLPIGNLSLQFEEII